MHALPTSAAKPISPLWAFARRGFRQYREIALRSPVLPGRYRSARLLSVGGMAEVYLASDELLERDVAVKVLAEIYAEDVEIRQRFMREALAAARLSG